MLIDGAGQLRVGVEGDGFNNFAPHATCRAAYEYSNHIHLL
jgi:hypothetical protein